MPTKYFLFLILFFSCLISFSQDSVPAVKKSEQSFEFIFDGFINSNAVSNNFIKSFYRGKFLDDDLKKEVSDALVFENRLGGDLKTGFTYNFHSLEGSGKPTFSFSYFDREHLSLSFSEDLFKTIFYGNKMFEGDTAKLWNFRANYLHYEQFRFGWKWNGDATHGSYGIAFSLLSGDQNLYLDGSSGGLYTAPGGSYLTLPLRMDVFQTDTAKRNYFSQNGMGFSTDLFYEMPFTFFKHASKITFAINDLGLIRWNTNSLHYSTDSLYMFSGIEVKDLIHLDSNAFSKGNTNHLINAHAKVQRETYQRAIPTTLDIHTKTFYGKNFAFEKGFKYYFNTSAFPYFYVKLHFIFGRNKNYHATYVAGYGGFGKFHSGAELYFDFAKKYSLALADNFLFTSVSQPSYGIGTYVKLVRKF